MDGQWLRAAAAGLIGLVGTLAPATLGPIEGSITSALLFYLGLPVIGLLAGLVGRGVRGLLGTWLGIAAAQALAVMLGFVEGASEGDFQVRIAWIGVMMVMASIGYLFDAWLRLVRRPPRPT